MSWQMVLGFEIHVELGTESKMFCGCPADHFGKAPNTQVCPVCLGLPGALPVPNKKAIEWAVKLALALNCKINKFSKFDRKNYFYPDLPKGYQISQYDLPFGYEGNLMGINITRVHLEEDTGKLQHEGSETLVDFNRSSVPLVEIVTEPEFESVEQAMEFLKELQMIIRALGISGADMEKGSMRLEANISVRKQGQKDLPNYKIEVKNVNSFRFIKKAIEFEVKRQTEILEKGETPIQETRGFRESTGETVSQRRKEQAHDYRYFPDPDIPPIQFTDEQISQWRSELSELPEQKRQFLISKYQLSTTNAKLLVESPEKLAKFNDLVKLHDSKTVVNAVINCPDEKLASLQIVEKVANSNPEQIKIEVKKILSANPKIVADIKSGKQQAVFFVIGQVKRALGDVDIKITQEIIIKSLIHG